MDSDSEHESGTHQLIGSTNVSMQQPTYRESIRIGWTVLWRCLGGFLALLFAVNVLLLSLMPELTRAQPSIWISLIPVTAAAFMSWFVIMPFVVRGLLSKSYRGFHLEFVRDEAASTNFSR